MTNKLTKVENWFHRQETKFEDFDIENHIRMTMEQAARYYSDVQFEMNVKWCLCLLKYVLNIVLLCLIYFYFPNKYVKIQQGNKSENFQINSQMLNDDIIKISLINDLQSNIQENELNHLLKRK